MWKKSSRDVEHTGRWTDTTVQVTAHSVEHIMASYRPSPPLPPTLFTSLRWYPSVANALIMLWLLTCSWDNCMIYTHISNITPRSVFWRSTPMPWSMFVASPPPLLKTSMVDDLGYLSLHHQFNEHEDRQGTAFADVEQDTWTVDTLFVHDVLNQCLHHKAHLYTRLVYNTICNEGLWTYKQKIPSHNCH